MISNVLRRSKALAILLTVSMATVGMAQVPGGSTVFAEDVVVSPDTQALIDKAATDDLIDSVLAGEDDIEVIVMGEPLEGVTMDSFETRADAMEHLDARAAGFFDRVSSVADVTGGEVTASWSAVPAIKVVGDTLTMEAIAALPGVTHMAEDGDDKVELIEPMPSDRMEAENSEGRQMIQAEEIWAMGFQGEGINVSVIDTGIDDRHEAFKDENGDSDVTDWADCQSNGCDESVEPFDDHGHGTHVAGTVLGSDDYDDPDHGPFEEVGVAPEANLMVAKFLGSGGGGSFAAAMDSLQWSFDNGADITSNSWGASCPSGMGVMELVNTLTDMGMLSVFAAGNSGPFDNTIGAPACADSPVSVGAVDSDEEIASFSSRGPCTDPTDDNAEERTCPDVVAKGVSVRSAIPRDGATNADPSGYKSWQGTSMATPHVAGAVALAEQMKRHFTESGWDTPNQAEEQVLKSTAKDLGDPGEDNDYGWGLVQLLPIAVLLNSTDEANIVDSFSISHEEAFLDDTVDMSFSVQNLGGALANGTFEATLTHPDGTEETVADETVSLGLLDGASADTSLTIEGNVAPGIYTFEGVFDYQWEDPDSGEIIEDIVEHEGTFEVKRVFFETAWEGLQENATLLAPQSLNYTATNTGNADAHNVGLEVSVPDSWEYLPGDNFSPLEPDTRYANPAPDQVIENPTFDRITLVWDVGSVAQGEDFSFSTQPIPTETGEYSIMDVLKYENAAGTSGSQVQFHQQTVDLGVPAP